MQPVQCEERGLARWQDLVPDLRPLRQVSQLPYLQGEGGEDFTIQFVSSSEPAEYASSITSKGLVLRTAFTGTR
jgi:hypothetical protein